MPKKFGSERTEKRSEPPITELDLYRSSIPHEETQPAKSYAKVSISKPSSEAIGPKILTREQAQHKKIDGHIDNRIVIANYARTTEFRPEFFKKYQDEGEFFVEIKKDGERNFLQVDDEIVLANKHKSVYITPDSKLTPSDFPPNTDVFRSVPLELAKQIRAAIGKHKVLLDIEYLTSEDDVYDFLSERVNSNSERMQVSAFDILSIDGKDVRNLSYSERSKLLEKTLRDTERVQVDKKIIAHSPEEAMAAGDRMIDLGYEGAVIKPGSHVYDNSEWMLKWKSQKDIDAPVLAIEKSKEWVNNEIPKSFMLGLYDEGAKGFKLIGQAGTGLSDKRRKELVSEIKANMIPPDEARKIYGSSYDPDLVYVYPSIVFKIRYTKLTPGRIDNKTGNRRPPKLREPRIEDIRQDKTPEECSYSQIDVKKGKL